MANKFGAERTSAGKLTFDSRREAERWQELKILERSGRICGLRRQVPYTLIPSQKIGGKVIERPCKYVADFVYEKDGQTVVEDVKGCKRGAAYAVFAIKRKLMLYIHGIRVTEVS